MHNTWERDKGKPETRVEMHCCTKVESVPKMQKQIETQLESGQKKFNFFLAISPLHQQLAKLSGSSTYVRGVFNIPGKSLFSQTALFSSTFIVFGVLKHNLPDISPLFSVICPAGKW